jgi:hypothetical protein
MGFMFGSKSSSGSSGGGTPAPRVESEARYDERRRAFEGQQPTGATARPLLDDVSEPSGVARPSKRLLGE